jgi:hypothetical protein
MTAAAQRRVEQVLEAKRLLHPTLRKVPSERELRHICWLERVTVVQDHRLPIAGALVGFTGEWTLFLSTKLAASLAPPTLLHELAHLWLHHDPYADRSEMLFTMLADESDDPREEEADYLVALVFGDSFVTAPIAALRPSGAGFAPLQRLAAEGTEGPAISWNLLEQVERADRPDPFPAGLVVQHLPGDDRVPAMLADRPAPPGPTELGH